jgi:hypothetical protein
MAWVRRAGILLTVLVVALGLGGASAGAKKKHKKKGTAWASKVTLTHPASNQFSGAVSSKLGACEGSRVVILFYTDPNNGQTSPLSVQRTDGKGKYLVVLTKDAFPGTYQAEVYQRKIRAMKAPQTCKAAQTPAVVVQ